ncbi:uncharacterized protein LOC119443129 [Dermacentor silvarum]|uniref:uncharacterized protein LOC119443129 n=1 Tax=Dermacentor silvarum TaxID=543639 RepID=UPI002101249A|nr:uncharacterized protein LOC119443129 [Dermacentor silvarum]
MDWGLLLRRLTAGAAEGQGQCLYAAVHNIQTGACIAYEPPEICPGVSESEVCELASSHRDPLRMYSGGVSICRLRFTFLKMEGKNVVLLRRPDAKCAVGFANTVLVVAVYSVHEPSKLVVPKLQEMCTMLVQQCY